MVESDMSMSDSAGSDDDFASTSDEIKFLEDVNEGYNNVDDIPSHEFSILIARVNSVCRELPIAPTDEICRLLDCCYELVIHRRDINSVRIPDFLKVLIHCFEKLLTDTMIRDWPDHAHKYVWLLCAKFMKVFATKLKFLQPNDPMMLSDYFHIAYMILSEKVMFHLYNIKSSSRMLPVHLDDPCLLENCTVYNNLSLTKGPGQHFKALLYVFAKYDGFDHLKKILETRIEYKYENVETLIKVGRFLAAVTCHLHIQFRSSAAHFSREVAKLLSKATDKEWMYKDMKSIPESPLIELALINKELAVVLLNFQMVERDFILHVDDVQLTFLLKTIQTAKLTGRTAAIEELYKILNIVAQLGDYLYRDLVLNISKTFDDLVKWFRENDVLAILLRDNLHLVTFVERVEKVLHVLLRRDALEPTDLEMLWAAQWGKHDAVQRNMLLMISRLSRFMNPQLIDKLFHLISDSFKQTQSTRERLLLLEFFRNLVSNQNNDQDFNQKAFDLTWQLYHDSSLGIETIEALLNVRVAIINTARNPEILRREGFLKCLEEIKANSEFAVPLFHQIRQCVAEVTDKRRRYTPSKAIVSLINQEHTISHVVESIAEYLRRAKAFLIASDIPMPLENFDACLINSQYSHGTHITVRLEALTFFIVECGERGHSPPTEDMKKLWSALIENPVSEYERRKGFNFFGQNLHCFSLETNLEIFNNCLLSFPPKYFTVNCFNEIALMLKYSKAEQLGGAVYNKIGGSLEEIVNDIMQKIRDFLWQLILEGPASVAHRAIEFATCEMEDMTDPERRNACAALFINDCFSRLKVFEEVLRMNPNDDVAASQAQRMAKALKVLLVRYENSFRTRIHPPLYRASMGRCFKVMIIFAKDDYYKNRAADARKFMNVNSNWTMRHFYKQVFQQATLEYSQAHIYRSNERMDLLSYHPSNGIVHTEAHVRVMAMLHSMKNEKFPLLNSGANNDVLRLVGRQSMRKTLGELHVDETTIFAARFTKSKRDSASFNFVSPMSRGDTPESSGIEDSDDDMDISSEQQPEMPQIILASNKERIFFLMDLADLAHKSSKHALRDELANLLDHLTATDEICQEIENSLAQGTLYQTIVHESPTKTAFYFHVLHSLLTPVIFTEEYLKIEMLFLSTPCIAPFFQFIEKTLGSEGYFPAISARILLSFVRMIKFASTCYHHIQSIGVSDQRDDDIDTKGEEDSFYNSFVLDILRMISNQPQEDCAAAQAQSDTYMVPLSILKSLMFVSWTSSRCTINSISAQHAPIIPGDEDEAMETCSNDTDSSFGDSYLEDIIFAKSNDRNEGICEMLTLEALEAFIEASKFCPDTPQLFTVPEHLLQGDMTVKELSSSQPSYYEFAVNGMLLSCSELIRTKIARSFFALLQAFPETEGEAGPSSNAFLDILFANLANAEVHWLRSGQYFECLIRLMDHCQKQEIRPNNADQKFQIIHTWLKNAKTATHDHGITYQREELLVYFLRAASHLFRLMPRCFRESLGARGNNFLQELFDDFLMPFCKAYHALELEEQQHHHHQKKSIPNGAVSPANSESALLKPNKALPICRSDASIAAGFALVADIVRDVPQNVEQALEFISQNFYRDFIPTITTDLPPPYLQRDPTVFVGLKNAGATCYMNSVIQQLFMIEPFRNIIMRAKRINEHEAGITENERKSREYSNQLIHSVQAMFAQLLASEEQYYTPIDFWDTFQFGGRDVNIREQQDAVEFFNALADGLDESLKKAGEIPAFEKLFGGTFADQKKCRDCPHMYEKEQLFTSIAVDIRSHNNLMASLNEYVTGDLLEGDNAYFCELCNAKVTAVKRICIAKLPPFLMIQLKRFDMDWNRGSPIKFFDYFEFPSVIDMEPFTSKGIAKRENSSTPMETSGTTNGLTCSTNDTNESTLYRLRGVVVHSGEAHGGHYYSYIADNKEDGKQQWYRFDDTDVSSWDYNEAESRINWYGGYVDSTFPNEKDRRRFSAYMLVYESIPMEVPQQVSSGTTRSISAHSPSPPCIPSPNLNHMDMRFNSMSLHSRRGTSNRLPPYWENIVTKNNLRFAHERFQYTAGYFKFIRDMTRFAGLQCYERLTKNPSKLAKQALHVFACFLFSTAIRTSIDFRPGTYQEWHKTVEFLFDCPDVARWFIMSFLTKGNILHCSVLQPNTTAEMRRFMERLIVIPTVICMDLADANGEEGPVADPAADTAADEIIKKILQVSKTHSVDFWNNGSHVLFILLNIASHSVQSARRLVSQNALYAMLMLLGNRDENRVRNFCRDNPHIFTFLDLIFTSCSAMKKPVKEGPIINPYARPSKKIFYVPENACLWLATGVNVTRFFQLMVISVQNGDKVAKLCSFLCWNNLPISIRLIAVLPFGSTDEPMKTVVKIFRALVNIEDDFQKERIRVLCLGNEMSRTKGALVECATASTNHNVNRILPILMEFLEAVDCNPNIKAALLGKPTLGPCLEKIQVCLERFMNSNGTGVRAAAARNYLPIILEIYEKLKQLIAENQAYIAQIAQSSASGSSVVVNPLVEAAVENETVESEEAVVPEEFGPDRFGESPPKSIFNIEPLRPSNPAIPEAFDSLLQNLGRETGRLDTSDFHPIEFQATDDNDDISSLQGDYDDPCDDITDDDEDEEEDDEELAAMEALEDQDNKPLVPIMGGKFNSDQIVKAGKKRQFNPPSQNGSQSSLPSYEMISQPTSRKLRHEQSPHTSPVKLPPYTNFALPSYEECTTKFSNFSAINTALPSSTNEYTGLFKSDEPPPV